MHVTITFRHMDASDAVRSHAKERLDKIQKYDPEPIGGHVVLSANKLHHYEVEVQITLHDGFHLKSIEADADVYAAVDLAMGHIEAQVRKHKEKIRSHRRDGHEARVALLEGAVDER